MSKRNIWLFCFSPSANSVRSRHIRGGRYESGTRACNHWEPLTLKKRASALHMHHPECSFAPFKENNKLRKSLHAIFQSIKNGWHKIVRMIKKALRKLRIRPLSKEKGNTWLNKNQAYRTIPTQVEPSKASSLSIKKAVNIKPHNILDDADHSIDARLTDKAQLANTPMM